MQKKKAYVVATAHLDTVWRWSLAKTLEEYIPDTISKNLDLIKKYPTYKFNFEGAYRYELIEELYPKAFEQIEKHVARNRWCLSGTAYENGDVNIPSPEALIRNILYGHNYFMKKFGKSSKDLFLPDCFGFGYAMPAVAQHCGLIGFTTQKLSWGSAYGVPFNLGILKGVGGSKMFACLNAGSYRYKFTDNVRADLSVINQIAENAENAKLPWANHLYGTGDWGGAPETESVKSVDKSVCKNKYNDFDVISASSDQIFKDIEALPTKEKNKLPVWDNELLMTSHGAGCYTSRCMNKRLNRINELMGDVTEKACVLAHALGTNKYPKDNIDQAWKRVIKHQFHDDITGTSTMEVVNESCDDYFTSISQFKNEYVAAARGVTDRIDTSWIGDRSAAIVVNNPTQFRRNDVVEANVRTVVNCKAIAVFTKDGEEVPSQMLYKSGKMAKIVFRADVDPFGFRAYEVRPADKPCSMDTGLTIKNHSLENQKYKIVFNRNGDIAYLYDKKLKREIIDSPIKMALLRDVGSLAYPSWEIRKEDIDKEPYCYANTPEFKIIENGSARIKLRIIREAEYSTITQDISLTADSEIVVIDNNVDWKTRRTMLKATFPFAAKNEKATYDLGLGVIQRGNNNEKLYEVPAQKWADISDKSGKFGVSVFSDCKYGWDKPNDNTLRLTCIHTPSGAFTKDGRQDMQDLGRNIFSFAIYSHEGTFENGVQKNSEIYAHPLLAVQTDNRKDLQYSDRVSYATVNNDSVIVRAIKHSEDGRDDVIIRVNEVDGKVQRNVSIKLFTEIIRAFEVNGLEEKIKKVTIEDGGIKFGIKPFEVKTFRLVYKNSPVLPSKQRFTTMELPYNAKGFTTDYDMRHVILQGSGFSLPFELTKEMFDVGGIHFRLFQKPEDRYDVLVCRGQEIAVPPKATRIFFIAGSTLGTQDIKIIAGKKRQASFSIKSISEPMSQWDMAAMDQTADINKDERFAMEFTHTHHPEGNRFKKARFNMYTLNVKDADRIVLPENNKVVILAMTAIKEHFLSYFASDIIDTVSHTYSFTEDIPPIDKIIDKSEFITIRAGKIQDQKNSGKGKGFKRDNIITNVIRSYTKSEW